MVQRPPFATPTNRRNLRLQLGRVAEHTLSPYDAFPLSSVLWWTLGAVLKGSPGLLRDFLTMGQRGSLVARELKTRRMLLARAMTAH